MKERIRDLLLSIKAPRSFLDDTSLVRILLMLYPTYSEKNLGPTLGLEPQGHDEAKESHEIFFHIFKEHNATMRLKFFANPLVRFLWKRFIKDSP